MKKTFWHSLFITVIGLFSLAGCNDDDNNFPIEQELAGHFIGSFDGLACVDSFKVVEGQPGILTDFYPTSNGLNFNVSKVNGNHINLSIKDLYFQGLSLDFELKDIEVSKLHNAYHLEGTNTIHLESLGDCEMTLTGSANPAAISCSLYIQIPQPANPQPNDVFLGYLQISFTGTRATGSESSEARIETFEFKTSVDNNKKAGLQGGTIDQTNRTIHFTCKKNADLKALKPTITVSPEETATVYPQTDTEVDFSHGQWIFSAVAADGTKVNYTVVITPREQEVE